MRSLVDDVGRIIDRAMERINHRIGYSQSADFPTKAPTRTKSASTFQEIVTLKLSPAGAVFFGTYVGEGQGHGVTLDAAGNVYLTGWAGADFATTPGAYKTTPGSHDVFVLKYAVDDTAPVVNMTQPSNGAWTGNSILLGAKATDSGIVAEYRCGMNTGVRKVGVRSHDGLGMFERASCVPAV